MPGSLARKGILALGAVAVLASLIVFALPLVASTQIVRDGVAYQMSAWSGYRVRLDETPDIRIWPTFRAVLHDVTLSDWSETDPQPVLETERVEIDLSALAALRGEIVFTKMRLIRPVLRLGGPDGELRLPPPQNWGRLSRSVAAAGEAIAASPDDVDTRALPDDVFGEISFVGARVTANIDGRHTDIVTSLTGELDWPALNRQATLSARGIWHGESVTLEASSTQPLLFLAGGNAPVNLSLEAAPATASFTGAASLTGDGFVDGQLQLSAPSLNRMMEWIYARPQPRSRLGAVSLAARVSGDRQRLRLEETVLGIDNSTGRGLLDVGLGPERPGVAGTLAFDTLNLRALLNAFSPFAPTAGETFAETLPRADGYDFDLRISAASASFGEAALTDVAAVAKVRDGLSTFDISDATAFGGTLHFGMRADRNGGAQVVEIRMVGEDINVGQLGETLGVQWLVPQARSNFSLVLKGTGEDLDAVLASADGTVSMSFGSGGVPGFGIDGFLRHSAAGDFFPLTALAEETLPLDMAQIKATLARGVAQIEMAEAESGKYRISLDGLVPIAGRALALYGTLASTEDEEGPLQSPLTFFVGGSWNAPFIASFLPPMND